LSRKSEQLMLAGPFCRQVGKASHSHAMGEPTLNSGFGDGLRRLPALDLPYNPLSTARRQPGILMHIHPVLPWNLKLQQPQLPRSEPDEQPDESSQLANCPLP
jgi:hypothetical protein